MKAKDIKEFELGEHCFGEILTVNGKEYEEVSKKEVLEFILDMFENDINSSSILRDTFKLCIEHLQYDMIDHSSSSCDQCGNYNSYAKYVEENSN